MSVFKFSIILLLSGLTAFASQNPGENHGELVDISCTPITNFKDAPVAAIHFFNLDWAWHDFEGNHLPHGYFVVDDQLSTTRFIGRTSTSDGSLRHSKSLSYLSVYADLAGDEKMFPDGLVLPNPKYKEFIDAEGVNRMVFVHPYENYTWEFDLGRIATQLLRWGWSFKATLKVIDVGQYDSRTVDQLRLRCRLSDQTHVNWLAQIIFGVEEARGTNQSTHFPPAL